MSGMSRGHVETLLSYLLAGLLLGYAGFQLFGWVGAILLPVGLLVVMAVIVAPAVVAIVGGGLLSHSIKGLRSIKQRLFGAIGRSGGECE